MRIISGTLGGRKIQPPARMPHTRPTTDLARGGLFNTLQNLMDFDDAVILDLFGGTGCISYEMISRGAAKSTLIEMDTQMATFIKKTLQLLKIEEQATVIQSEVFRFMNSCTQQYDFIFAGPPYALQTIDDIPDVVFQRGLLKTDGIFVLEHTPRNDYQLHPHFFKIKNYGTTVFSFFK